MERREVDVAVLGGGTAGLNALAEAKRAGKSWLLVEPGPYGTTCARVGCMPSKLLIAASEAAHHAAQARVFGVNVAGVSIDGVAVMKRVREERDRFTGFVVRDIEELPASQRLCGHARFVGPTCLRVDDHTEIEAGAVVIATGSSPFMPPNLEPLGDRVMVNDDLFELTDLPASMAIFGTGIIALELGQALSRLGVRVSFFNPFDEVGFFSDPEVKREAAALFSAELPLHLNIEATVAAHGARGAEICWRDRTGEHRETFESVLAAAGRRPNLDLGLEASGLELGAKGVPLHDEQTMQCGDSTVFIAGDVCGHRPLLHESADEGRIAGANAARYPDVRATVRRASLAIAFTDPQMAIAGARFADLDPEAIEIGTVSYDNQGRARVIAENRGRVRVYGERGSCRLLGAEMLGPRMEHMAHLVAWAVQSRLTVNQVLELPFYHPNLEEGLRTALRDLCKKLRALERCRPEDRALQPGA